MRQLLLGALCLLSLGAAREARAGGCYVCRAGSAAACRDYCRYEGADTFDSRHRCEAKGCRVSGSSSCPEQGDARICLAPQAAEPIAQCSPPPSKGARPGAAPRG